MSDDNATTSEEGEKKKGPLPMLLSLAAGVVVSVAIGACIGLFLLGPKLAPSKAAAQSHQAPVEEDSATEEHQTEPSKAPLPVYVLENLVLNPAGSNGTRFLLLSVAIAVKDEAGIALLKARDAEIRDNLLSLFGSKSIDQVWEASARDGLRQDVVTTLAPLFPSGVIKTVYFPQFVIQ